MKIINRKGQVALFVIIAIALVAVIALIFMVRKGPGLFAGSETNPQAFIEQCTNKYVEEAVDIMLPQGGFLSPENYKLYKNIKVAYLCENRGFYQSCINQHPMFLNEIKGEILNYTFSRIDQCFSDLKKALENEKNSVQLGNMNIHVDLGSKKVYLDINRDIQITNNAGENRKFKDFKVKVVNPIYDLGNVAVEIAGQEAKFCYFDYVGYMLLYPSFDIKKVQLSDPVKIYTIKDLQSKKEMNIAIRSCAIPPGI